MVLLLCVKMIQIHVVINFDKYLITLHYHLIHILLHYYIIVSQISISFWF